MLNARYHAPSGPERRAGRTGLGLIGGAALIVVILIVVALLLGHGAL